MIDEKKKKDIESQLDVFRKASEHIREKINPMVHISDQIRESLEASFQPMKEFMDRYNQWNEALFEKLKSTLEVIRTIQEKHKEGKDIRGAIVTDIIDLDELLEEIILRRYVIKEQWDEFNTNLLNDESCSTAFKMKVVNRTGLLKDISTT